MYEITVGEGRAYKIPALDFRGGPTGIDIRKVIEPASARSSTTGIAHKDPGVGQSARASCIRRRMFQTGARGPAHRAGR
jgi:hypothetical protein